MKRVLAIAVFGLGLSACSGVMQTMPDGSAEPSGWPQPIAPTMVWFESEPVGAEIRTSLGQLCRSPCSFAVSTSEFEVTFSLPGYISQTVPVRAMGPGESLDGKPLTSVRLSPNPVQVSLQPVPPPPPPKVAKPARRPVRGKEAKARSAAAPLDHRPVARHAGRFAVAGAATAARALTSTRASASLTPVGATP